MPENVNISVNGHSQVPPGFRFHPTEEELLHYYLQKKVAYQKIDLDVIRDVDLNKLEPWEIKELCKIGSTPQNDWYFFSHKDKKYPTGTRTNRATRAGFWKATGRDKVIHSNSKRIGMRKTLVFYTGRAPHGKKSDWIMHEYRLDDNASIVAAGENDTGEEGWVVCRIFKKKNYIQKTENIEATLIKAAEIEMSMDPMCSSNNAGEGTLEQILQECTFIKLPSLSSPELCTLDVQDELGRSVWSHQGIPDKQSESASCTDWVERLLNWQSRERMKGCLNMEYLVSDEVNKKTTFDVTQQDYNGQVDDVIWQLNASS